MSIREARNCQRRSIVDPNKSWGIEAEIYFAFSDGSLKIDVRNNNTSLGLIAWLKGGYFKAISEQDMVPDDLSYVVAGEKALAVYYPKSPQSPGRWQLFFQRGQKVFEITYGSVSDADPDPNFDVFQHFLSSFEFEDTKNIPDILPQESDFR